jgi:hypothetical protein
MSTNINKLYTIFTSIESEYIEVTLNIRNWIADNELDAVVLQKEAGEEADLNGQTHDYVTQFGLELPSLVCIKQQEGSSTLVCETVAQGVEAIINLPAETIASMKAAYAETQKTPTQRVSARRV